MNQEEEQINNPIDKTLENFNKFTSNREMFKGKKDQLHKLSKQSLSVIKQLLVCQNGQKKIFDTRRKINFIYIQWQADGIQLQAQLASINIDKRRYQAQLKCLNQIFSEGKEIISYYNGQVQRIMQQMIQSRRMAIENKITFSKSIYKE